MISSSEDGEVISVFVEIEELFYIEPTSIRGLDKIGKPIRVLIGVSICYKVL